MTRFILQLRIDLRILIASARRRLIALVKRCGCEGAWWASRSQMDPAAEDRPLQRIEGGPSDEAKGGPSSSASAADDFRREDLRRIAVLVIEDDKAQQDTLNELFTAVNTTATEFAYAISCAGSASAALEIIRLPGTRRFDLIILDIELPDMHGTHLLPLSTLARVHAQ